MKHHRIADNVDGLATARINTNVYISDFYSVNCHQRDNVSIELGNNRYVRISINAKAYYANGRRHKVNSLKGAVNGL